VPFLSLQEEHKWQRSWVDDFAGQSRKIFFAPTLALPANLEVGRSWLFAASSVKFLTSLKSRWVYLAPHEDDNIRLLSTVRPRRWKNNFVVHLKVLQLIT
jgi:hypothetical protein